MTVHPGPLASYQLQDRYQQTSGRVFLTGTQALVRVVLDQARRDRIAGLNTAGFVSGYRGSPLGRLDQELWRASDRLNEHKIEFLPAVNEDLAATAILGTQQVGTNPKAHVEGVFALWYGKGPGVDRAGDIRPRVADHRPMLARKLGQKIHQDIQRAARRQMRQRVQILPVKVRSNLVIARRQFAR